MFVQPPIVFAVPTGRAALAYDFAPLFLTLVIGVCFCVLTLAFAIGVYDSGGFSWRKKQPPAPSVPTSELPHAA